MAKDKQHYSVSCDGIALGAEGELFTLPVYTDGEAYNAFVMCETDVQSRTKPNETIRLLDTEAWLTAIWRSPSGRLYVGDSEGNLHHYRDNAWQVVNISTGAITCMWGSADDEVYAAGDEGVVYRWNGAAWAAHSPALGATVFCIGGWAGNGLYACGGNGLLCRYDGNDWKKIELPEKQDLTGVAMADKNNVWVCGKGGALWHSADATWPPLPRTEHDFYALAHFQDTLFLSGGAKGVFCMQDGILTSVKDTIPSYRLDANREFLASAGANVAARFDGNVWFGTRYS